MPLKRENRYVLLLLALLVLLIGIPLADQFAGESRSLARVLIFSVMLSIGVWSLPPGSRSFYLGIGFAVVGMLLSFADYRAPSTLLHGLALASIFGFLITSVLNTLGDIAFDTRISVDRLVGAICVYLLLGMLWAVSYTLVEIAAPGSFNGIEQLVNDGGWQSDWLYFSFVTMTTLGYGDVSPITPLARLLAYLQATAGLFYIAILVAGLVGAYVSARGPDQ